MLRRTTSSSSVAESHRTDPLTHLNLSVDGQREAATAVGNLAARYCGNRWIATGGGGYNVLHVNPLGYHTGSVWPHDTAMAVQGLYATGHGSRASSYVEGLIRAAEAFDYRLPELYGGRGLADESTPTP